MEERRPQFSELSRDDALAFLGRHHVGRLAFAFHDHVDIEPISYVYSGQWIYARTSPGTKLTMVKHHPWVAFEVDEVNTRSDWVSVVIRGTIYFLPDSEGGVAAADYNTALELLRSTDADALTDADATPHRQTIFRIHIDEVTGRRAIPA